MGRHHTGPNDPGFAVAAQFRLFRDSVAFSRPLLALAFICFRLSVACYSKKVPCSYIDGPEKLPLAAQAMNAM